jgi:hypothetical protein
MENQLLCTFTTQADVDIVLENIFTSYEIFQNRVYILENVDDPSILYCTYNVINQIGKLDRYLPATINFHRKKKTNTLYTINALNYLIKELNGGVLDKTYQLDWAQYQNMILLITHNTLKKIKTNLHKIITH